MKVAVLSYPMLFQAMGGLQVQVNETIAALLRLGCEAELIDPVRRKLTEFDLVHVYSVINGNHRLVERARALGVPVVLSPLVRPYWTRGLARRAALIDRLMGRLTGWKVTTEYQQILRGLQAADRCVALGPAERTALCEAFGVDSARIDVIPNGIPQRFFDAEPGPFLQWTGLQRGYVLCVAAINPHKNQLGLAKSLRGTDHRLVLVGECLPEDQPYLASVLAEPHVHHVGAMNYDDPLLPSAYAGAGVMALTSGSEVMPLSVMEALAAGRPAVMTRHHCMDLTGMSACVTEVEPSDEVAVRGAIARSLAAPSAPQACREAVRHFTWDAVAGALMQSFNSALNDRQRAPGLSIHVR